MRQNEERDPTFVIEYDNQSVLRLKQFSATKKMQWQREYDFTPEAALARFVAFKRALIKEMESEIETARTLVHGPTGETE